VSRRRVLLAGRTLAVGSRALKPQNIPRPVLTHTLSAYVRGRARAAEVDDDSMGGTGARGGISRASGTAASPEVQERPDQAGA